MDIWLIRAGRNAEREDFALKNGVAVIGWGELGNLGAIKTRDELKVLLRDAYPKITKGQLNNFAGQVWAFRKTIVIGSYVVLPLKTRGTIAIGKIAGDYKYHPDNPQDARHTRAVKWIIEDVPRASFSKRLLFSFGAFMTVCRISRDNAEAQITKVLKGEVTKPVTEDVEEIDDTEAPTDLEEQARLAIRQHIEENFAGHRFADIVTAVLTAQGFECLKSEPGPDEGVDILAGHGKLGLENPRLCVQVKSSTKPAEVAVLKNLVATMKDFGAEKGLLVSWGGFKKTLVDDAKRRFFEVRLWTAEQLIEEVQRHYSNFPDTLKAELRLKRVWTLVPEGQWVGE